MENEELILRQVTLDPNRMHISGKATPVNSEGNRNFTIVFDMDNDAELVNGLMSRNWPIKIAELNNGKTIGRLKVLINYKKPVTFTMLIKKPALDKNGDFMYNDDAEKSQLFHVKSVALDEENSKQIDDLNITNVKVVLNLSTYTKRDGSNTVGYCVYLKEMQFTKLPSAFEYDKDSMDIFDIRPDLVDSISDCPFEVE